MKLYHIFRRFHRQNEDFIFVELICVFDNLLKAIEFIDNEKEIIDKTSYKHLDTYVLTCELNTIYDNIMRHKDVLKKKFNTV